MGLAHILLELRGAAGTLSTAALCTVAAMFGLLLGIAAWAILFAS